MKILSYMLVCLLCCVGLSAQQASDVKADENGYIVYEGQACPDFSITLTDGRTLRMSELKGKVVMLQFTASWCSVCRKEMPFIEKTDLIDKTGSKRGAYLYKYNSETYREDPYFKL